MFSRDQQEALIERSWERIASIVESGESRDAASVRAVLHAFDTAWQRHEASLIIGLSGFAYGQIMERARQIAASRRSNAPISDQAIDDLRIADDVEKIVRELFALCEPENVEFQPSLN